MAKDLPYFKFIATEWLTGSIVYEPLELQGLFINICALYWQREGVLSLSEIEQRYKKKTQIAKLTDRFISVIDGFISIEFLNEQLSDRQYVSKKNSNNGKLGGRPMLEKNKPKQNPTESELKPKKSNIEEEEEKNKNKNKNKALCLPFESVEFTSKWDVLKKQKKWKGKSLEALQESLNILGKNSEALAIEMMSRSIAGGWQGVFEIKEDFKTINNGQISKHNNIKDNLAEARRINAENSSYADTKGEEGN